MKLVEELRDLKKVVWVLTGNGPTECRVLKGSVKKYDGSEKVLFFPKIPLGFQFGSGTSVLKVIKVYVSKYNANNFFCLLDKEHIETSKPSEMEIGDRLKEFGITVDNLEKLSVNDEEALRVEGKVGIHKFALWIAINGKEKCIEENIAKLLKIEFGENIKPTKEAIRNALRNHNIEDLEHLVSNVSINKIERSFPAIHTVLSRLEDN